ncbi:MAG: PilN domain-containing protein [Deltaproteobacteria bacterium]|nr:PilN domain-containing protein [Deltaproteobacteria bacterium]
MIRINLMPRAKRAARATSTGGSGSSTMWAGAYFGGALITIALCAVWYVSLDNELQAQIRANNELQQRIEDLRGQSQGLEEVQAKLQQSLALAEVVEQLEAGRTGPTRVLMELSNILSTGPGAGPTIDPEELERLRRDNPLAGFNRNWDPRRLSIAEFTEEDGETSIGGAGRTNEDVAEFLRRLALSEIFVGVTLQETRAVEIEGIELIGFEIHARVEY